MCMKTHHTVRDIVKNRRESEMKKRRCMDGWMVGWLVCIVFGIYVCYGRAQDEFCCETNTNVTPSHVHKHTQTHISTHKHKHHRSHTCSRIPIQQHIHTHLFNIWSQNHTITTLQHTIRMILLQR